MLNQLKSSVTLEFLFLFFFVLWHKLIKTDLSVWRHHFDLHRSVDKDFKASITDY